MVAQKWGNTMGSGEIPYRAITTWAMLATPPSPGDAERAACETRTRRESLRAERYDAAHLHEWFVRTGWVGAGDDDGYPVYYACEAGTLRPILGVEAESEFGLCALMRERYPHAVRALDAHEGRFA